MPERTTAAIRRYHDEVVQGLTEIGDPRYGEAVRRDRGSQLPHLGIPFPDLRRRVRQGFSFYDLPEEEVLATWDRLWRTSSYGDVLFAALEYYLPLARKGTGPELWPTIRGWSDRVDNWCHADVLGSLYSWSLERDWGEVYPQLEEWNRADGEWLRRLSLISLVRGRKVVLPPDLALPLVSRCLGDPRHYVQTAVGWVLRELGRSYSSETAAYLEENAPQMSAAALSRATERQDPATRARLRALRKTGRER